MINPQELREAHEALLEFLDTYTEERFLLYAAQNIRSAALFAYEEEFIPSKEMFASENFSVLPQRKIFYPTETLLVVSCPKIGGSSVYQFMLFVGSSSKSKMFTDLEVRKSLNLDMFQLGFTAFFASVLMKEKKPRIQIYETTFFYPMSNFIVQKDSISSVIKLNTCPVTSIAKISEGVQIENDKKLLFAAMTRIQYWVSCNSKLHCTPIDLNLDKQDYSKPSVVKMNKILLFSVLKDVLNVVTSPSITAAGSGHVLH